MLLWQQAVTDRSQNDVERVLELLEKRWKNFTDDEKSEWSGGMKGALNLSDLLRIQNNVSMLKDVLELDMDVFNVGKNLLQNKARTTTSNGVTFSVNDDGSVTANGTATAKILFNINVSVGIDKGNYIFSGCPNNVPSGCYLQAFGVNEHSTGKGILDTGSGCIVGFTANDMLRTIFIYIADGVTVSDITFYPMIRYASVKDDAYETYSGRNLYVPTEAMYAELLRNVEIIRRAYCIHTTTPETPEAPLNTYSKWNDIERILADVYEILLNNFYYYCGSEIYAGDDTGLLL